MEIKSSSLTAFTGLLRFEIEIFQKLLESLKEEKRAFSQGQLDDLRLSNKRIETLLIELRVLEEGRKGISEGFADELQMEPRGLTLSRLSEAAPEPFATDLRSCHTVLSTLLKRLGELIEFNTAIIEHSFKVNGSLITFLGSRMTGNETYDQAGALEKASVKSGLLARRA
jgi:flagellar biosynthesis/type III secretory pathway chaperone